MPYNLPAIRDGLLYGRGGATMKGSMAAVQEVARVLLAAAAQYLVGESQ